MCVVLDTIVDLMGKSYKKYNSHYFTSIKELTSPTQITTILTSHYIMIKVKVKVFGL